MKQYCPYTDQELDKSLLSSEHIIPLSLGGVNGFEIPVCKIKNSELGSKIDAKIGNELIIQSARSKLGVKSQSGKTSSMYFSNAKDGKTGLPLQADFTKDGLKLNTPYVPDGADKPIGETINLSITSDLDIWLKYTAKTFLSAAYYAYGDKLRYNVDTKPLRIIMNYNYDEWKSRFSDDLSEVLAHHIYSEDINDFYKLFRKMSESITNASCVVLMPSSKGLGCFVSILGNYIGSLHVNADTIDFPNEGLYEQGHLMCVQNGKLECVSFASMLRKFNIIE